MTSSAFDEILDPANLNGKTLDQALSNLKVISTRCRQSGGVIDTIADYATGIDPTKVKGQNFLVTAYGVLSGAVSTKQLETHGGGQSVVATLLPYVLSQNLLAEFTDNTALKDGLAALSPEQQRSINIEIASYQELLGKCTKYLQTVVVTFKTEIDERLDPTQNNSLEAVLAGHIQGLCYAQAEAYKNAVTSRYTPKSSSGDGQIVQEGNFSGLGLPQNVWVRVLQPISAAVHPNFWRAVLDRVSQNTN